jgi:hypothetical protein
MAEARLAKFKREIVEKLIASKKEAEEMKKAKDATIQVYITPELEEMEREERLKEPG